MNIKTMDLLNIISHGALIFMYLVLSLDLSIGLEYTIEPEYINIGDNLKHLCEFQSSGLRTISRYGTPCFANCMQQGDGCQLDRPDVSIDCNDNYIQINISQAQVSDFGEWRCSAIESVSILIQEYGQWAFVQQYIDEVAFVCKSLNPRIVICMS